MQLAHIILEYRIKFVIYPHRQTQNTHLKVCKAQCLSTTESLLQLQCYFADKPASQINITHIVKVMFILSPIHVKFQSCD